MKPLPTPPPAEIKKRSILFEFILVILVIGFGVLAFFAKQYSYFPFDLYITKSIQIISWPIFSELMVFITSLGYTWPGAILLGIGCLLLLMFKKTLESLMLFFSTSGALLLSLLFKLIVSRPRPDPLLINQAATYQVPDSFPSGHVLFFVGFLGYIVYLLHLYLPAGKYKILFITTCLLLIILMGVSRIYLGAHWFSDTLGAYLVGTLWLTLMVWIRHRLIDNPFKKSKNK